MAEPVLAVIEDLIFRSKLQVAAEQRGAVTLARPRDVDPLIAQTPWALVIVDLSVAEAVELVRRVRGQLPRAPIVGFVSHVQLELQREARAAGCTAVVPRSVFVQWLPELVLARIPA